MNLDNFIIYEHSTEALEAVKSGNAVFGSGGIFRKGELGTGYLEPAKQTSLSGADLQSLFEGKEHALETDEHLKHLDTQLALSAKGMKEIENIGWLNNTAIQRTYVLTYEGFCQTLHGLETVVHQLSGFEQYVRRRDFKQIAQETQKYINYLKTDAGLLMSKKYSVTNGNIAEHLDQISALIKRLLSDIENNDEDSFLSVQILRALLQPFVYVVRQYSALYYYENDGELKPGNYDEWVEMISSTVESKQFRDKLAYYINLKTTIPFKDKMLLSKGIVDGMKKLYTGVVFGNNYITTHSKDEYLSIGEQIRQKIESRDYYIRGRNAVIFLDDGETKKPA